MELETRVRCKGDCKMCDHLDVEWALHRQPKDLNFPAYAELRAIVARAYARGGAE